MANVYLPQANQLEGSWLDYPRQRLQESYQVDVHNIHKIVDNYHNADVILYVVNNDDRFPFVGLGIWFDPIYRNNYSRCILLDTADSPSPVIGGLCASWPKHLNHFSGLAAGWCYHHPAAAEAYLDYQQWPDQSTYLWSFKGSRSTHSVRESIMSIADPEAFIEDTSNSSLPNLMELTGDNERNNFIQGYVSLLRSSAFIVCPRGAGASSMRIFEAMRAGRAPVIIADDWTPPSFVDWDRCSLRLSENEVHRLPDFLREHRADAEALGRRAFEEWSRVFGSTGLFHYTTELCLRLIHERQEASLFDRLLPYRYLIHKPWRRELLRSAKRMILSAKRS